MKNSPEKISELALTDKIEEIRNRIRVTKITCTRQIQSTRGNTFVGVGAAFQNLESPDQLGGVSKPTASSGGSVEFGQKEGMSLTDARIAQLVLSLEAEEGALMSACANGSVSQERAMGDMRVIKQNILALIREHMEHTSHSEDVSHTKDI